MIEENEGLMHCAINGNDARMLHSYAVCKQNDFTSISHFLPWSFQVEFKTMKFGFGHVTYDRCMVM